MAVTHGRTNVTTSATAVATEPDDQSGAGGYIIANTHATVSVDLGGPGVTSGAGVPLAAGASIPWTLQPGEVVYAAAASGTVSVAFARSGL